MKCCNLRNRLKPTASDVNQCVNFANKGTLLHIAARTGCFDCVHELVKKLGANLEVRDEYGETPLYDAIMYEKLHVAQLLLDYKANVNTISKRCKTPLNCLSQWRIPRITESYRKHVIKLLLDYGAVKRDSDEDILINTLCKSRECCRRICLVLVGIRYFQRSPITRTNVRDVIKIIVKEVWKTRFNEVWQSD